MTTPAEPRQFLCAQCGRLFWSDQTDDAALDEMVDQFGPVPEHARAIVCSKCFEAILAVHMRRN